MLFYYKSYEYFQIWAFNFLIWRISDQVFDTHVVGQ